MGKFKTNNDIANSTLLHTYKPRVTFDPPTITIREQYVDDSGRVLTRSVVRVLDNRDKLSQLRVSDFSMSNLQACGADKHLRLVSMSHDNFTSHRDLTTAISKMESAEKRAMQSNVESSNNE